MFLFRLLFRLLSLPFRLLSLPFRLVFWVVGLVLWVLFLPLRLVLGLFGLIGVGRLLQLGVIVAAGYFLYRLVTEEEKDVLPPGPSEPALRETPST